MSEYAISIPPELEGVLNALSGWAATHNPYALHSDKEAERDAWACGWKVVQDYGQEQAGRAVALVRALGLEDAAPAPIEPMSEAARVKFVLLTHFNLARQRLIRQHDAAERTGNHRVANAYAHAASILGEEYEAARAVGQVTVEEGAEMRGQSGPLCAAGTVR